jgi:hypothetical protein
MEQITGGRIVKAKNQTLYTIVPNSVAKSPDLTWKAKGLLLYLLSLPEDWVVYKSELHNHSLDGRAATCSAFDELEKNGYILSVELRAADGRFKGCEYVIYPAPQLDFPIAENRISEKRISENRTLQKKDSTKKEDTNTPIIPKPLTDKMEGFDEFWKLYPRHTSKKVAELKWKGLSPAQKDAAIKALPKHIQGWAGKEMQFIPHPATWLNQRRWEDEVVSDSTKVSTQPSTQPQKAYTMYKVRNAPGATTYPGKLTYFATWEGGNKWCHFGNMSPVPFTHSGNPDRPYINHPITEEVDKAIRAAFSVAGYIDNFEIITFDQINQITKW